MTSSFIRLGSEFAINTLTAQNQTAPAVASFENGNFVAVWGSLDSAQDGSDSAIKGQLFSASGARIGAEFLVNTAAPGSQFTPAVTTFGEDRFIVTWVTTDPAQDGSGNAIKAQIFDSAGAKIGAEFLVNSQVSSSQFAPNVAELANGGFVISWDDYNGFDMKAQVFDAAGGRVGTEFRVNTRTDGFEEEGDIVGLAGGGFVATWRTTDSTVDGSGQAVRGQIFDAAGARVGSEFMINNRVAGHQYDPTVAALADGGFAVAWYTADTTQDGSDGAIKAQIFSASGGRVGGEFLVNTQAAGNQNDPAIVGLADGGFAVTWVTSPLQYGGDLVVSAQIFDGSGNKVSSEFPVPTPTGGSRFLPDIAQLENGNLLIAWTSVGGDGSGYAVHGQIFGLNLAPIISSGGGGVTASISIPENLVAVMNVTAIDAYSPSPLRFGLAGGVDVGLFTIDAITGAIAFAVAPDFETPRDANGDNVYEVIVAVTDGELSSAQNLSVSVANVNEGVTISSELGADAVSLVLEENLTAVNIVAATDLDGDAVIFAITGGPDAGLFMINAATGILSFRAALDYEAPADAGHDNIYDVVVQASDGSLADTQSLSVTITNDRFETFTGTAARDILTGTIDGDTLLGLAGDDDLVAGDGDDVLNGGAGNDRLDGGAGSDSATYADAAGAVRVDLQLAIAQNTGAAGKDLLIGVEHLTGSAFNDQLSGNDLDNRLIGGAGIDTIKGAAGDDILIGDDGNDLIEGGAGADLVAGGVGNDRLKGGTDGDTLIGGDGNDTLDGDTGADILAGGAGSDIYLVDDSGDTVTETDAAIATGGVDLVRASISHVLGDNVEKLTLVDPTGSSEPADIDGTGNALGNIVIGNGGDNTIRGLEGNDTLDGGAGDDLIVGGLGNDATTGGGGSDIFLFDTESGIAGRDTIKDFAAGPDRIALALSAFGALAGDGPGALSAGAFTIGTKATSADHHIVYNEATGALYYDADGAGGLAQMQFATLIGRPALSEADFVLI